MLWEVNGIENVNRNVFRSHSITGSIIRQLFQHDYRNSKVNGAAFDIFSVINDKEIVNLTVIKYKFLDEWLPEAEDNANSANMDETMTSFNLIKSWQKDEKTDVKKDNEDNYWRCVNILQVRINLFYN